MIHIERLHLLDLNVVTMGEDETIEEAIAELTNGLLVQGSVLISDVIDGMRVNQWPIVRFTGPRSQLEELRNRYNGIPFTIDPDPRNPDPDWSNAQDTSSRKVLRTAQDDRDLIARQHEVAGF